MEGGMEGGMERGSGERGSEGARERGSEGAMEGGEEGRQREREGGREVGRGRETGRGRDRDGERGRGRGREREGGREGERERERERRRERESERERKREISTIFVILITLMLLYMSCVDSHLPILSLFVIMYTSMTTPFQEPMNYSFLSPTCTILAHYKHTQAPSSLFNLHCLSNYGISLKRSLVPINYIYHCCRICLHRRSSGLIHPQLLVTSGPIHPQLLVPSVLSSCMSFIVVSVLSYL